MGGSRLVWVPSGSEPPPAPGRGEKLPLGSWALHLVVPDGPQESGAPCLQGPHISGAGSRPARAGQWGPLRAFPPGGLEPDTERGPGGGSTAPPLCPDPLPSALGGRRVLFCLGLLCRVSPDHDIPDNRRLVSLQSASGLPSPLPEPQPTEQTCSLFSGVWGSPKSWCQRLAD